MVDTSVIVSVILWEEAIILGLNIRRTAEHSIVAAIREHMHIRDAFMINFAIRAWHREFRFLVVNKIGRLILEYDFLAQAKVVVYAWLNGIIVMDEACSCFVNRQMD